MTIEKSFQLTVTVSIEDNIRKVDQNEVRAANYIKGKEKEKKHIRIADSDEIQKISAITWHRKQLTAERLLNMLCKGHASTALYHREDTFNWIGKFEGQWKGNQIICLDADDSNVPVDVVLPLLQHKPTFTFTTQSHLRLGRKNRFRLVYVFDSIMHNRPCYDKIITILRDEVIAAIAKAGHIGFKLDNCTYNRAGFFFGNPNSNIETITPWCIYSPYELLLDYDDTPVAENKDSQVKQHNTAEGNHDGKEHSCKQKSGSKPATIKRHEYFKHPSQGARLVSDCTQGKLTPEEIWKKFRDTYKIKLNTTLPYTPPEQSFIIIPKGYQEVSLQFQKKKDATGKKKTAVKRFRKGERHITLRNQLIICRDVHEDKICFDELLYHAVYLFYRAYENKYKDGTDCKDGDIMTLPSILQIVRDAWVTNLEAYEQLLENNKKKFEKKKIKVNPGYCEKNNVTPEEAKGKAWSDYTTHLWNLKLDMIAPEILAGNLDREELAALLTERSGEKVSGRSIDRHKKQWLEEHRAKVAQSQEAQINVKQILQRAQNQVFKDEFCDDFAVIVNNLLNISTFPSDSTALPPIPLYPLNLFNPNHIKHLSIMSKPRCQYARRRGET